MKRLPSWPKLGVVRDSDHIERHLEDIPSIENSFSFASAQQAFRQTTVGGNEDGMA